MFHCWNSSEHLLTSSTPTFSRAITAGEVLGISYSNGGWYEDLGGRWYFGTESGN